MNEEKPILKVKDIYLFYALYFFIVPLGFLIRILYSRTISLEEFGIIYALISFFGLIHIFTNLGLANSLMYFIPKYNIKKNFEDIKNLFYYNFIVQFISTIIISSLIYLFAEFLAINYFKSIEIIIYIKIFIIYFIFLNFYDSLRTVFIAFKKNNYYHGVIFFQMSFILLFSYIFFLNHSNGILSIIYAKLWAISAILTFFIYIFILFKNFPFLLSFPKFKKKLFLNFISYSSFMFVNQLSSSLLVHIDILLITYFYGLIEVGIYSNAYSFIGFIVPIFTSISILFMPIFSELKEKKDYYSLNYILNVLYTLLFFFVLPISLIFFLFPEIFIKILFGESFLNASSILAVFSLFSILNIFNQYHISFLSGLGLGKNMSKILVPIVFLNLILNFLFIKLGFGIIGIAYATIISWFFIFFFTYRVLSKEIKFKLNFLKSFLIILNGFIFIILVLFMKKIVIIPNYYINSLFILIFCLILYLILGYLMKIFTLKELYVFIPDEKTKNKIIEFNKKYFKFIK